MLGFYPLAGAPLASSGAIIIQGYLAATEASDTASGVIGLSTNAALAATETQDTAAIAVNIVATISLAATEATDTASAIINSGTALNLNTTELKDFTNIAVNGDTTIIYLQFGAVEDVDNAGLIVGVSASADLIAIDAQDAVVGSIFALINSYAAIVEAPDVTSFAVTSETRSVLTVTETQDTANGLVYYQTALLNLNAVETQDTPIGLAQAVNYSRLVATEAADTSNITLIQYVASLAATEMADTANANTAIVATLNFNVTEPTDNEASNVYLLWAPTEMNNTDIWTRAA